MDKKIKQDPLIYYLQETHFRAKTHRLKVRGWENIGHANGINKKVWIAILISYKIHFKKVYSWGFPGGTVVENLPANAGDTGSSPGLGRSHMPRSS